MKCALRIMAVLIGMLAWARVSAGPVEISFEIDAPFELKGTLHLPDEGEGPWPAVLFISGSGPTDRDGNQGPIRTDVHKQLAEALAEAGIASFRFDKRAMVTYASDYPRIEEMAAFFRLERFVDDATRALAVLRAREEIDADRVGVLGHSEGGLIAMLMATGEHPPVSLLLASAPGRPIATILREQIVAQLEALPRDERDRGVRAFDGAMDAIRAGEPLPSPLPAWSRPIFNLTSVGLLRDYAEVDPLAVAREVRGPALVLIGGADFQVSPERDAEPLAKALGEGRDTPVEARVIDGASHNLKPVDGPGDPGFDGEVVPEATDTIVDWFRRSLAGD
jgi:fermentation-respiration switch protein FrsA (DUF1100 family)